MLEPINVLGGSKELPLSCSCLGRARVAHASESLFRKLLTSVCEAPHAHISAYTRSLSIALTLLLVRHASSSHTSILCSFYWFSFPTKKPVHNNNAFLLCYFVIFRCSCCCCCSQAILGVDIVCQAKSGMGKTAVFVLATLHQLNPQPGEVTCTRGRDKQVCRDTLIPSHRGAGRPLFLVYVGVFWFTVCATDVFCRLIGHTLIFAVVVCRRGWFLSWITTVDRNRHASCSPSEA